MNEEYIHKDTKTDEPLQQELQNYFQVINGTSLYYENYVKQIEQELDKYKNIIDELEKDIKKEIKRTEELILEDGGLIEITNIRKMLNDERKNMLFKLDKLKELKGIDN